MTRGFRPRPVCRSGGGPGPRILLRSKFLPRLNRGWPAISLRAPPGSDPSRTPRQRRGVDGKSRVGNVKHLRHAQGYSGGDGLFPWWASLLFSSLSWELWPEISSHGRGMRRRMSGGPKPMRSCFLTSISRLVVGCSHAWEPRPLRSPLPSPPPTRSTPIPLLVAPAVPPTVLRLVKKPLCRRRRRRCPDLFHQDLLERGGRLSGRMRQRRRSNRFR